MPDLFIAKKNKVESSDDKLEDTSGDEGTSTKEDRLHIGAKEKDPDNIPFKKRKSHSVSPLLAFAYMPKNIDFVTKAPEEKVVLLLRKHPITNLSWILITIAMLFAPVVLRQFPILEFLPERFRLISVMGWYMITVAFVLQNFLSWFFNVNIITDERIIDIDFVNLIYREISEAKIDNIQDFKTKLGSVTRTMFNYGDVFIQTASEVPNIEFLAVPKPDKIAELLRQLQTEEEQEKIEGRVR